MSRVHLQPIRRLPLLVLLVLGASMHGCDPSRSDVADRGEGGEAARVRSAVLVDVTAELGLPTASGVVPDGTYFLPEIMGPGVAVLDHDGDGDLDLLQLKTPPPGEPQAVAPNRLFEQLEDGRFVDRTAATGLGDPGFAQGVAVGDVDNDGDRDVYFANHGTDRFYLNAGSGVFSEVGRAAGFDGDRWSAGATFCDFDRDGFLDLYVAHYLDVDYARPCRSPAGVPDYCGPATFDGVGDTLYRNDGDGTFTDVSRSAGVDRPESRKRSKGLGVVCLDLTGDAWPDFYVANDGEANQLWVNNGDGTFSDQALSRGVAVNRHGRAEASMGIAVGDVAGDGQPALLLTHLALENNTLYVGDRTALYLDRTVESGLPEHDLAYTGFGCGFFDLDHDANLDLAIVNGAVRGVTSASLAETPRFWDRYAEPNLLLLGDGEGGYVPGAGAGGVFTSAVEVSRGLAFGDLDDDGDLDLVVSDTRGALRVHRNDAPPPGAHWLAVRTRIDGRDAIGARVRLIPVDGRPATRWVLRGYSYQSSNDPRAHFGLGAVDRVETIDVLWPDGTEERFVPSGVDREVLLQYGEGSRR